MQRRPDVGGKTDGFHGEPVRLMGRVLSLHDGRYRTGTEFMARTVDRGPVAVIYSGCIEVVLASRHTIVFEPNHFRSLGIEPTDASSGALGARLRDDATRWAGVIHRARLQAD